MSCRWALPYLLVFALLPPLFIAVVFGGCWLAANRPGCALSTVPSAAHASARWRAVAWALRHSKSLQQDSMQGCNLVLLSLALPLRNHSRQSGHATSCLPRTEQEASLEDAQEALERNTLCGTRLLDMEELLQQAQQAQHAAQQAQQAVELTQQQAPASHAVAAAAGSES